jgi:hypothetical protein
LTAAVQFRAVPMSEIAGCPQLRMDPEHFIPAHRTWEHYTSGHLTDAEVVKFWLQGRIPTSELEKAIRVLKGR